MKLTFSGEIWPWHQDYICWPNEDNIPSANIASVMIFLDDINALNGPALLNGREYRPLVFQETEELSLYS